MQTRKKTSQLSKPSQTTVPMTYPIIEMTLLCGINSETNDPAPAALYGHFGLIDWLSTKFLQLGIECFLGSFPGGPHDLIPLFPGQLSFPRHAFIVVGET
jgi:hypothetical protein